MRFLKNISLIIFAFFISEQGFASNKIVDNSTLRHKIMTGYQGWHRVPNDGSNQGWVHHSKNMHEINAELLAIDFWPDTSEFALEDKCEVPDMYFPDGSIAYLVSEYNPNIVKKHFEWMRDYDIDGAFLQVFVSGCEGGRLEHGFESRRKVMDNVRMAAKNAGRVWAVSFDIQDLVQTPIEEVYEVMIEEWKRVVDAGFTKEKTYLHEDGLPVVQIWGYFYGSVLNTLNIEYVNKISDFFANDPKYKAFLCIGGDWAWLGVKDKEWTETYERYQCFSPWNAGHTYTDKDSKKWSQNFYWKEQKRFCEDNDIIYMPTVNPGISIMNISQNYDKSAQIVRHKGEFLWRQLYEASKVGLDSLYIAMFDEIDEGTAVYKISPQTPIGTTMFDTEGMPSDWYLRLIRYAATYIRQGEEIPHREMPKNP